MSISEWFLVEWDDREVRMNVNPPGKKPWKQGFLWEHIIRICYSAEGLETSDGIYIFTSERPESYVIPVEASGGSELWGEILNRGLFDARLAIKASTSTGGIFCWPE